MGKKTAKRKRGGKLLASGNNTCVYDPPIKCDGVEVPPNTVSRIVPKNSVDSVKQDAVKQAVKKIPEYKDNFNFYVSKCDKPNFSAEDIQKPCSINDKIRLGVSDLQNLYTPKQDGDINEYIKDADGNIVDNRLIKSPEMTLSALKNFLHAIVALNSSAVQVFHADGHVGNISWIRDKIVLHDWEKTTIGDIQFWKALSSMSGEWGPIIGTSKMIRDARARSAEKLGKDEDDVTTDEINSELGYEGMIDSERWQDLATNYPHWQDPVVLLHDTEMSDRYAAGKECPIRIAAVFRCWDLFSIIRIIQFMFAGTVLQDHPTYIKIRTGIRSRWAEINEALNNPISDREGFLKSITTRFHEIIDDAYASGGSRTRRQIGRSYQKRSSQLRALNIPKPSSRRS
jgi:hypothetical protein